MSRTRSTCLTGLVMVAAGSLTACGGGGDDSTAPVQTGPASVAVTAGSGSIRIGEKQQLRAEVRDARGNVISSLPAGSTITWSTSDTTIVVVSATGEARGVRDGSATLTASLGQRSGTTAITVTAPRVQSDAGARASARVGPDGGTITTTAGGKRYVLTIPRGALRDSTDISLTPLTSVENLPTGTTLLAGADFAPSGLKLTVPATLRISGVSGGSRSNLVGFDYQGSGSGFQRAGRGVRGDTVVMMVTHFSGTGVVTATDVFAMPWPARSSYSLYALVELDVIVAEGEPSGTYNVPALVASLQKWYTTAVRPALQTANSDSTLLAAIALYSEWDWVVRCGGTACEINPLNLWSDAAHSAIRASIASTANEAQRELANALKRGIDRSSEQCRRNADFAAARNVWFWVTMASLYEAEVILPELRAENVLANFCVKVVYQEVSFPAAPEEGVPAALRVRAGLSYGGAAPIYTPQLFLTVDATGFTSPFEFGNTGADGVLTMSFTPTGDSNVRLNVRASPPRLEQYGVLRDTVVRRDVSSIVVRVEPVAALLDPGAQAQFVATVSGTTNRAVTWSQTGGSITSTGLYTAGSTPGTYSVTATSVANPAKKANARVEIFGERVAYTTDFESGVPGPEWSSPNVATSPNGKRFLGPFQSGDIRLSLTGLGAHGRLTVEFDVYAIDTWDGNNTGSGPDVFAVSIVGGPTLKRTTFSNIKDDEYRQSYPGDYPSGSNPAGTGGAINTLGYPPDNGNGDRYHGDVVYRMRLTVSHTGSAVTLSFAGIGLGSSPTDERWGLDNVRISVAP